MFFVQEHFAPKKAERTALFSLPDRVEGRPLYRYALGRTWDWTKPRLHACLLNPSPASEDDAPAILRLIGFAGRWGYGGLGVVSLFGLISPDPKALGGHEDPFGPGNRAMLAFALNEARRASRPVLAAWGDVSLHGETAGRAFVRQARAAGVELACLGLTDQGRPRNPLDDVRDDAEPVPFDPPRATVKVGGYTVPLRTDGRPVCARCDGSGRAPAVIAYRAFSPPEVSQVCGLCGGSGEHPRAAA